MRNQKYSVKFNFIEFGELSSDISKTILEQIYFIHADIRKISFPNGVLDVECFGLPTNSGEIKKNGLRLINETIRSFSKVEDEVTEENSCETIYFDDPMKHLISSGNVTFTAPGICVLQGDVMKIMSNCEKRVRKIALLMGAEEQTYPVRPSDLKYWLNYVEKDEAWFDHIADSFRSPKVWAKTSKNEWVKRNIWD